MSKKTTAAAALGTVSVLAAVVAFFADVTTIADFFDDSDTTEQPATNVDSGSSGQVPEQFLGAWGGTVPRSIYTYSITVTITPGPTGTKVADVRYGPCGGWWSLQTASQDQLRVVEVLTSGHQYCVDRATIELSLQPDGTMRFQAASTQYAGVLRRA
ncbi:MAG: hypothetical protein ACRDSK_17490 [Actinophytocola sp.]|uniref:hypothetical protein n=1 Tax=Actinophytocola sp. TaxID=1872138 RepID=UPI003D6B13ED